LHELGITEEIIARITERLQGSQVPLRVSRVVLEIGKLVAVLPDSIRFCFELCGQGTPVEGAALEIIELPAIGSCRSCESRVESDLPYAICPCGSAEIAWRSGQELRIKEMEVA
jgi:hydrogenase nickel incorporation protein HypA/HybF